MSKVSNVNILETWGYDELFPILKDAFRVLYISCSNLRLSRKNNPYTKPENVKNWYLEDIITDDLVNDTKNIQRYFEYRIQKQQPDFETNVKIDIAILYSLKFDDNSSDLKIECKRLDNIPYIINDGISSFKNNKYSKKLTIAGMLLYNTQKDIESNITSLNNKITSKISPDEILQHYPFIDKYKYTYKSIHKRTNNADIDIYHCVIDYSDLIESSTISS